MVDSISPLDLVSWTLAISSDEAKNARLKEIQMALAEVKEQQDATQLIAQQAASDLQSAKQLEANFDNERAALAAKQTDLALQTAALEDVQHHIQVDKAAFEEVRAQVETKNSEEASRLSALDEQLTAREQSVTAREEAVTKREQVASELHEDAKAKIDAMTSALQAVAPPPEPAPEPAKDAA